MSLFDLFKKKTEEKPQVKEETYRGNPVQRKVASSKRIEINFQNEKNLRNCFIAFDVETTGLSPASDRIIEIGAVLFQNGRVSKTFSSLVNPNVLISRSASSVNHITNAMLAKAPYEREIYPQLIDFLGDALHGGIVMCAHNAKFDFDFLCNTLSRLGYSANIEYIDTLSLSRKYLHGLENYKQGTIEKYFGLTNSSSHRAVSDAENCGRILYRLLDVFDETSETERAKFEKSKPNTEELEVCAYIQNVIYQKGGDITFLRFRKNSSNYVDVCCLNTFLKVKFSKKGRYILIKSSCPSVKKYVIEPCTQTEGGTDYVRVYFSSPFDLEALSGYMYKAFSACHKSMKEFASYSRHNKREIENSALLMWYLSNEEVSSLLEGAREHDYPPVAISSVAKPQISRDDVIINAVHNRVPLNKIENADNRDKGFQLGFPYWEKGERARKEGNFTLAIEAFDKARFYGYDSPDLYNSYAKTYRQLKDYSNEIIILDEGISRVTYKSGELEARRTKAINLLFAQQEKERKATENAKQEAEKQTQNETATSAPKQSTGRAIIQMDDEGNIIKEYCSISVASQELGVNSKSIRNAANGVQKRAGGYRWMFKE